MATITEKHPSHTRVLSNNYYNLVPHLHAIALNRQAYRNDHDDDDDDNDDSGGGEDYEMMMPLLVHGGGGCDDYDAFVRGWWVLINKTITIKMKASRTITISIVTCP